MIMLAHEKFEGPQVRGRTGPVCFVYPVDLVHLGSFAQRKTRQTRQTKQRSSMLANCFSILLRLRTQTFSEGVA